MTVTQRPDPASGPPTSETPKSRRGRESVGDMARSFGLLALVVAVSLIFVPGLLHPSKRDKYPPQTYTDQLAGFGKLTGHPALAPTPLPAGWRTNAASLSGPARAGHLHVGFVVPGGKYVGLEETTGDSNRFVLKILGSGATGTADATIGGATWQRRISDRHETAFTRTVGAVTVVVTGSASDAQLTALAASLR